MKAISTHVLDTSIGRPAAGINITLELNTGGKWVPVGGGQTNADGRVQNIFTSGNNLAAGIYRLTFELEDYFKSGGRNSFYPSASITFKVEDPQQHYHVPLLLSGFGYSTYRGS